MVVPWCAAGDEGERARVLRRVTGGGPIGPVPAYATAVIGSAARPHHCDIWQEVRAASRLNIIHARMDPVPPGRAVEALDVDAGQPDGVAGARSVGYAALDRRIAIPTAVVLTGNGSTNVVGVVPGRCAIPRYFRCRGESAGSTRAVSSGRRRECLEAPDGRDIVLIAGLSIRVFVQRSDGARRENLVRLGIVVHAKPICMSWLLQAIRRAASRGGIHCRWQQHQQDGDDDHNHHQFDPHKPGPHRTAMPIHGSPPCCRFQLGPPTGYSCTTAANSPALVGCMKRTAPFVRFTHPARDMFRCTGCAALTLALSRRERGPDRRPLRRCRNSV